MIDRELFPSVTPEFDARVRQTLAALPEKRRRRLTGGKIAAIALAAALCLGGTALAAGNALFPLLFPGSGDAVSGYVEAPAEPVAENGEFRLTVDGVLFDESSNTGVVSLRLEDLKGYGEMPFKVSETLPEYRLPGVSWSTLAQMGWNDNGECYFDVTSSGGSGFTGRYYLDTERSGDGVYYIEAALIAFSDYMLGDALTLNMYQLGKDGAVLKVVLPEPKPLPSLQSGDGSVTLSQVGLRVRWAESGCAVDDIDYVAIRMADGSETVVIDEAGGIDRTLYTLGGSTDTSGGGANDVATYLLSVIPELENVRSIVINDIEYALI